MGPGGSHGLQSRCEARRTSLVCSIRTRLRHFFSSFPAQNAQILCNAGHLPIVGYNILAFYRITKGHFIMDIRNTITTLLHDNLDIDPEQVTEDSTFDSLGIDSLDMVELICDLEDECGIEFGEPENLETVGDLISYIEGLQA